ncbi:MAG: caspase family protein [Bacteroidota bacterium]
MNKSLSLPTCLVFVILMCPAPWLQAQKFIFEPLTPGENYWDGETYYVEDSKLRVDFRFLDKKLKDMSVLNTATGEERKLSSDNFMFTADIGLKPGMNEILVFTTKKRSKFERKLQVFLNEDIKKGVKIGQGNKKPKKPKRTKKVTFRDEGDALDACDLQLVGSHYLSPEYGNQDLVISRDNKTTFDLSFMLTCCSDEKLKVSIENPRQQSVEAVRVAPNQFRFPVRLFEERNRYVVRAKCEGQPIVERGILIKANANLENRVDTAIIFAVNKHDRKARKLGWSNLKYSMDDAEALKWVLENKFNFGVQIIKDPTWEEIKQTMDELRQHRWNSLDQVLIYFTGHGHQADGRGYLIPSNVGSSIKTYYKMEDFREQVDEIGCNNITLGIDACFASSFLERGKRDVAPRRSNGNVHELLSTDLPFRYFIGSAPSNREVPEKGIFIKDSQLAKGRYGYMNKRFRVSEFMMSFLMAMEAGEKEMRGAPIPIWYIGRKVEELYRPRKLINGQQIYARATRFGSQNDKGFHFIGDPEVLQ